MKSHFVGAVVFGVFGVTSQAAAQPAAEVAQIERDASTAAAEMARIEAQYREVPDLFAVGDRDERAIWGSIYHLNKEYARASLALYGAVEPRDGETAAQVEAEPTYAESLFFLADSHYELGNVGAAREYFEKLLLLKDHGYEDDAILRLMAIAADDDRYDDVDRYYASYLATAGDRVPGQVRYLRAKSLFRAGRNEGALQELARIPNAEAFDLRARYLRAAIFTKEGKLIEALAVFDDIAKVDAVAHEDPDVKTLADLGRGRLLYELDRLDESIDAYQQIDFDSKYLTTMLYEVTLTYVRRGQLALRAKKGDGRTDAERRAAARVEYRKALRQLDDLRAVDPEGERAADIELLAANLRLQRLEFDDADGLFLDVLEKHRAADAELQRLISDVSLRDLLLQDILALENDPHAVLRSPLPPIAARRAARNKEVAESLAVFKDIQKSRADVESAQRLLDQLDQLLSTENASRAELFGPLQSAVERSLSLANSLTALKSSAISIERKLARPAGELKSQLDVVADRRGVLEKKIAQLPKTPEEITARKKRLRDRVDGLDRKLHELDLVNAKQKAVLASISWLAQRELGTSPAQRELLRGKLHETQEELKTNELRAEELRSFITRTRRDIQTVGGRGSAEEQLRTTFSQTFDEERAMLQQARDPQHADVYRRLDEAIARLEATRQRNVAFRDNLDVAVEQRLTGARALLATEREALATYARTLADIDLRAAALADAATAVALERVRRDLSRIVLRADVGVVDTAFGRKQTETEHISALQKARAAELTDLTQAYADLTRDELP